MASKTIIITTWRSLTSYLLNNVKIHFPMSVQVANKGTSRTISMAELDEISVNRSDYDTEPEISLIEKGIYNNK